MAVSSSSHVSTNLCMPRRLTQSVLSSASTSFVCALTNFIIRIRYGDSALEREARGVWQGGGGYGRCQED
jgi:hypothetical protein